MLDVEHVVDGSEYVGAIKDQENGEQGALLSAESPRILRRSLLPGQVDEYDDDGAGQKGEVDYLHRQHVVLQRSVYEGSSTVLVLRKLENHEKRCSTDCKS